MKQFNSRHFSLSVCVSFRVFFLDSSSFFSFNLCSRCSQSNYYHYNTFGLCVFVRYFCFLQYLRFSIGFSVYFCPLFIIYIFYFVLFCFSCGLIIGALCLKIHGSIQEIIRNSLLTAFSWELLLGKYCGRQFFKIIQNNNDGGGGGVCVCVCINCAEFTKHLTTTILSESFVLFEFYIHKYI